MSKEEKDQEIRLADQIRDGVNPRLKTGSISQIVEESFLRYSMSVIVARALPDVRDGLKPVHRRILYSMFKSGLKANGKTIKSARIIGDVMGKYHPHGNLAIYDAMARLSADWSTRYPLVIGQGNFGSMEDPPAADRYTEAKLSKIAEILLLDIDKDTVDFQPNYDGTETEPQVLPSLLPNLLLNGQIGIAVGMATSIPPHNLAEVIDASLELIDNPEATIDDLMKHIKGPDFPTGGIIYSRKDLKEAYSTGRGGIVVRGKATIEERGKKGAEQIVITEIPYNVKISSILEKTADLVRLKKIKTISAIRDESSHGKVRIVIDLKRDAYPQKVLNQLYKRTALQTSFHYNMVALVDGIQPKVLNLIDILSYHLKHRQEVVRRRTEFELKKARKRAHILEGLKIALDNIDAVIKIIRASKTTAEASKELMDRFELSKAQVEAILAMPLRTLVGLERQKIEDELNELLKLIDKLEKILSSEANILKVVKDEMIEIKEKLADKRLTKVIQKSLADFSDEDLIPNQRFVLTLTSMGYLKRTLESSYKSQRRGGKGRRGITTRDSDLIQQLITASSHDQLLFFTNMGRVFGLKCYQIPESSISARGIAAVNLLQLRSDEKISFMFKMIDQDDFESHLVMCTQGGVIKKTLLNKFQNLRQNGLIAINLKPGDELKWVRLSTGQDEIVISTAKGQLNRFSEADVRAMGRAARGVRGIRLKQDDYVVGMDVVAPESLLVVISQNGYGKKTKVANFNLTKRGGVGVKSAVVNKETGKIVAALYLEDQSEIMSISKSGKVIRSELSEVRVLNRVTKGVRMMKLDKGDVIVSVILVSEPPEIDADEDNQLKIN